MLASFSFSGKSSIPSAGDMAKQPGNETKNNSNKMKNKNE